MPAASILIKPASANCNMDCKYCFTNVSAVTERNTVRDSCRKRPWKPLSGKQSRMRTAHSPLHFREASQRWQGWIFSKGSGTAAEI